jgi:glycosyltransferase involved in cell wall biosynthesis
MNEKIENKEVKNPSISIAMATYNGSDFLMDQLVSIFSQTHLPDEIVVCDDCSTDNTLEILEEARKVSPVPFKYFQNDTNMGVTANFKKAVSLTKSGNYVALADQDDIWLPKKIEKSAQLLSEIDDQVTPSMIYSDLIMIDSKENILNLSVNNELSHDKYKHCLSTLLYGNFVLGCTIMMNDKMKCYLKDIPDDTPFNHDAWLSLIGFSFGKIACLPESLIKYRKHQNNTSFTEENISTRSGRILNHLISIVLNKNFLEKQIKLAKSFHTQYCNSLSKDQTVLFKEFIALKDLSYLRKKIAFERSFKKYWISR